MTPSGTDMDDEEVKHPWARRLLIVEVDTVTASLLAGILTDKGSAVATASDRSSNRTPLDHT